MITFISGGARSGKSRVAEELAEAIYQQVVEEHEHSCIHQCPKGEDKRSEQSAETRHMPTPSLYYLATSQAMDLEMAARIARHIKERGSLWQTVEEPYNITRVLQSCQIGDVVLVDCLTIWLNNVMFSQKQPIEKIHIATHEWVRLAEEKSLHLLFVSNDVNEGMPSSYDAVHDFMKVLEDIHCHIVQKADQAIQVVAGIPVFWKGNLDLVKIGEE